MRFLTDTQTIPRDPHSTGPKVLAAGLWRCATSSLQMAFEQVLSPPLAPSMHGAYLMPSIPTMKLVCAACVERDPATRRKLVARIFAGYNASSDFPGMALVDDLLELYPEAKVVLNKRSSAAAWKKSVDGTLRFFSGWRYAVVGFWVPQSYWHWRAYRAYMEQARRRFGTDDIFSERFYELHNEWVRGLVKARGKELLEWEPGMGWEPLCAFLGREVPDCEFPQSNETEVIVQLTRYLIWRGLAMWCLVIGIFATAVWSVLRWLQI